MKRYRWILGCGLMLAAPGFARAHGAEDVPAGPIRDRMELMEHIGDDAKAINEAVKAGKTADALKPAENIASIAPKFTGLFPDGSEDPKSRARPNIWTARDEFDAFNTYLVEAAQKVADIAREGGDLRPAVKKMFGTCKSCHDKFRIPEED